MAIPYGTTKFKSANILAIAILGSTAKFIPANISSPMIYTYLMVSVHCELTSKGDLPAASSPATPSKTPRTLPGVYNVLKVNGHRGEAVSPSLSLPLSLSLSLPLSLSLSLKSKD